MIGEELVHTFTQQLPVDLLPGSPIYAVRTNSYGWNSKRYYIDKTFVKEIGIDRLGWYITTKSGVRNSLKAIGKALFLTLEDAEAHLRSLE